MLNSKSKIPLLHQKIKREKIDVKKLDGLKQKDSRKANLVRFLNPFDDKQINFWALIWEHNMHNMLFFLDYKKNAVQNV